MQEAGRKLVRAAMSAPYLERDEERTLAVSWKEKNDLDALHSITVAHMRLVIAMAGKFRKFGLSMADLVQEGHVGLLEAAARFDPGRDVRFSTYASWWIRASMQDYILRNWSIVRCGTSSTQKALFFNLRRLQARLRATEENNSRGETYEKLARDLRVSVNDVAQMDMRLGAADTSLNAGVNNSEAGSTERMEYLVSDAPLPDQVATDTIDGERRRQWLNEALHTLNMRELKIVRERRLSEEGATLEALGTSLGISKERVRQIESKAMEKLRTALVKCHPELRAHAS